MSRVARIFTGLLGALAVLFGLDRPRGRRVWLGALILAALGTGFLLYHTWCLPFRGEAALCDFFMSQSQESRRGLRALAFTSLDGEGEPLDLGVGQSWDFPDLKSFPLEAHQNFCIRWLGLLEVSKAGDYRFGATVDDGLMILVDGREVVSALGRYAPHEVHGEIHLDAGAHALEIRYQQYAGGAVLNLWWRPPEGRQGPLDPALLTPLKADAPLAQITRLRLEYGLTPHPGSTHDPFIGGRFWRLPWF